MKVHDLNLSGLRYFVDSIECRSLSMAAEKNHVSRPAVSQAIYRIEEAVGFALLTHKKNDLELTVEGQKFFLKAKRALVQFEKTLREDVSGSSDIHVGCSFTVAQHLLLPKLGRFVKVAGSQVKIHVGSTAKVRQLLQDGVIQIGFFIDDGDTHGLDLTVVREGKFVLRSKNGRFKSPVITPEGRAEVLTLKKELRKRKRKFSCLEIESWSLCQNFVASSGVGTCLVPDLLPARPLKSVALRGFKFTYKVVAAVTDRHRLSLAEQKLLAELKTR